MTKTRVANVRENAGRIDHIVMIYHTRESQEAARQQFSALLGIDDWEDLGEVYESVHVIVSWGSGLELLRPTRADSTFEQYLAMHGEGFYCLVFGVADLDQAMARIVAHGGAPSPFPRPPEAVFDTFEIAREAVVGEVGGIHLVLGEFKPIPPQTSR